MLKIGDKYCTKWYYVYVTSSVHWSWCWWIVTEARCWQRDDTSSTCCW